MKKITYIIEMPYTYEAERSGSKYCIGGKYKNHGEFEESVMKHRRGLDYPAGAKAAGTVRSQ